MQIRVVPRGPELSELVERQTRALATAMRGAGREIGDVGERAIVANAGRVWGRSFDGRALGVRTTARGSGRAGVDVTLDASGPWGVPEGGAKAHGIKPKGRALRTKGGRFYASVSHPGVRGRRAWSGAESTLDRAAAEVVEDAADRGLGV